MTARAKSSSIVLPPDYRPSEDEPFMNERQRMYFRQKLLAWKDEIIRQTRETLAGLHEESTQHADLADRATSETDRALELARATASASSSPRSTRRSPASRTAATGIARRRASRSA